MRRLGSNLALVFPGQGAQFVGMGRDLYEASPAARVVFGQADEATGLSISRLCFEGPEAELMDTANAQPAIVTASVAALAALREALAEQSIELAPAFAAGHSIGQYSALVASGLLDFPEAIRLVARRGQLMKEAGARQPGGMAAVLGAEPDVVEQACREVAATGAIVCAANYNLPSQTVISGTHEALRSASALLLARGAKKVLPLAVSVANHSPLMEPAARDFATLLDELDWHDARLPVVANGSARPVSLVDEMLAELRGHMTGPVRWTESMAFMTGKGVTTFWELGPGQVLAGLIKRTAQHATVMSIGDHACVLALCSMLVNGVVDIV